MKKQMHYEWLSNCIINEGGYLCNNLIRQCIYTKNSNMPINITMCEDLLISFKLFESIKIASKLNYQTYFYRQHFSSVTHSCNVSETKIKNTYESNLLIVDGISKIRDKYKLNFKKNNILTYNRSFNIQ